MKNQKGFTLIELMVVIVIIGILSAVALPKMFSMSNKAKASEVQPAAATYERLQQTYIAENSALGFGTDIGWDSPQSKFFTYGTSTTSGTMTIDLDVEAIGDCKKAMSDWSTAVDLTNNVIRTNAGEKCGDLTPSFVSGYKAP